MRRGRVFFYLAFILILGVVAIAVVYLKFLQPTASSELAAATQPPVVEVVDVVVVTQKIPRGSILEEGVVGVVPMQRDLVIQGMFTNVNEVIGRQAKFDLDSGIPLTHGMLVDSAEQLSAAGSNAALSIPRGMVSVSIPISRLSSVSYAPQPGDHVNVIVTMLFVDLDADFQTKLPNNTATLIAPGPISPEQGPSALTGHYLDSSASFSQGKAEIDPVLGQTLYLSPSEAQRPRLVSQTLLQDAVVLRMGTFPLSGEQPVVGAAEATTPEEPAQQQTVDGEMAPVVPKGPDVITLIVSPQDAVTLNYLLFSGAQLTLALRAAGDDSRIQTEAVTLQFLLDQYNIPIPVKLPYGAEPRTDLLVPPVLQNDIVPTPEP